jgi:hypothetical protein
MKTLIKLTIASLVIHATWRAGSAYWVYYQFRDNLQQVALFSAGQSEQEVHNRALEVASELKVPIEPEQIAVRRQDEHTFIDASYKTGIEVLPRYRYPWEFKLNVDAWSISIVKPDEAPQ